MKVVTVLLICFIFLQLVECETTPACVPIYPTYFHICASCSADIAGLYIDQYFYGVNWFNVSVFLQSTDNDDYSVGFHQGGCNDITYLCDDSQFDWSYSTTVSSFSGNQKFYYESKADPVFASGMISPYIRCHNTIDHCSIYLAEFSFCAHTYYTC